MRAHTVILGAGATIAAIPNGDKNRKYSSVMSGLIEKLHLDDVLEGIVLQTNSDNLEDIYSELHERPECKEALQELERRLYAYFASLEIPDYPTIYDLLILSLTEKDVIATFNWDPLLLQAYVRCASITENLPHILCLHGNVAMVFCKEHREFGMTDASCPVCGRKLLPMRLLYPVKNKDYSSDDYISSCWEATEYILENSYMLTIFGYSAPTSDIDAVRLLKKGWGSPDKRYLEEVSVIDIISEDQMLEKWKDFIHSHHYKYTHTFYGSYLGMFPRRSCEMVFATYQLNIPPDCNKGFYEGMSWEDVYRVLDDLFVEEQLTPKDKNLPLHYVHPTFGR